MRLGYRTCFHTLYDEKKNIYIYIYIYTPPRGPPELVEMDLSKR